MIRPSKEALQTLLIETGSYSKLGEALGVSKATAYRWCQEKKVVAVKISEPCNSIEVHNVLALPDLHMPFHNVKALEWAKSLIKTYNISRVIQLGDLTDSYAWSRWDKDPDSDSPQKEFDRLRYSMHHLHKLFPELTIITGNHDTRMLAKASEANLPVDIIRTMEDLFPFEGWEWRLDRTKPLIHDGIAYVHGDEVQGGLNVALAAERLGMSVVMGHSHQGRLMYSQSSIDQRFGMSCGCLVDVDAYSMRYSKLSASKVWIGVGVILNGVPHLIPYPG